MKQSETNTFLNLEENGDEKVILLEEYRREKGRDRLINELTRSGLIESEEVEK